MKNSEVRSVVRCRVLWSVHPQNLGLCRCITEADFAFLRNGMLQFHHPIVYQLDDFVHFCALSSHYLVL